MAICLPAIIARANMIIPEGTTHVWTPPLEGRKIFWCTRLVFYKKKLSNWCVYSNVTGWRTTTNTPEWFAEEKKQGYFVTITKFNSPTFVPKKEVM